ncbi:MAG: DUF2085 domain-containing protein [Chloroflexota bacterium]|nr:DUF2085 domain-containing protein [Chloroflexota bacterium]
MSEGQRRTVILADRFVFWLSRHWLAIFNVLAFLYVGLPLLAPVLMHLGAEGPAMAIYTIYRPLCNQLPQRSWFLFGPQFTYTLQEFEAGLGLDLIPNPLTWTFVGSEALGYKMALCQRCTATNGSILLFGLFYALGRRRVRSLPLWAYIGFGLVPMAMDGGYQALSYAIPLFFPNFPITPHETTAFMRTLTGGLFGLATVWLAYPLIQEVMDEYRETLQQRFGWGINEQ